MTTPWQQSTEIIDDTCGLWLVTAKRRCMTFLVAAGLWGQPRGRDWLVQMRVRLTASRLKSYSGEKEAGQIFEVILPIFKAALTQVLDSARLSLSSVCNTLSRHCGKNPFLSLYQYIYLWQQKFSWNTEHFPILCYHNSIIVGGCLL